MDRITSRTNPRVQRARSLREGKYRKETGCHFVEGDKLVREALSSGVKVETVFVREGYAGAMDFPCETLLVSDSVMDALSTAGTPQSLCAVARTPALFLPEAFSGTVLLLEDVQDPGNVGTLIRTADALGASCVILSPQCADPFSPKTLRSSMGSVYHLPVYTRDIPAALNILNTLHLPLRPPAGERDPAPQDRQDGPAGGERGERRHRRFGRPLLSLPPAHVRPCRVPQRRRLRRDPAVRAAEIKEKLP